MRRIMPAVCARASQRMPPARLAAARRCAGGTRGTAQRAVSYSSSQRCGVAVAAGRRGGVAPRGRNRGQARRSRAARPESRARKPRGAQRRHSRVSRPACAPGTYGALLRAPAGALPLLQQPRDGAAEQREGENSGPPPPLRRGLRSVACRSLESMEWTGRSPRYCQSANFRATRQAVCRSSSALSCVVAITRATAATKSKLRDGCAAQ